MLDLKQPSALQAARKLASGADIVPGGGALGVGLVETRRMARVSCVGMSWSSQKPSGALDLISNTTSSDVQEVKLMRSPLRVNGSRPKFAGLRPLLNQHGSTIKREKVAPALIG